MYDEKPLYASQDRFAFQSRVPKAPIQLFLTPI